MSRSLFEKLGHLLLHYYNTKSYERLGSPIHADQPFSYVSMVWAVAFGWMFFNDIPALTTLLGSGIIILSGIYAFRLKQQEAK